MWRREGSKLYQVFVDNDGEHVTEVMLMAICVEYDRERDEDGYYGDVIEESARVYVDQWAEGWVANFASVAEAVAWLEGRGYERAFAEQDDDWGDPVNVMLGADSGDASKSLEVVAVYGK